jgi:hypothetical protein
MKTKATILSLAVIVIVAVGYLVWPQKATEMSPFDQAHLSAGHEMRPKIPLSPLLVGIASPSIHWEERIKSVNQLPDHLDSGTVGYLFDYLSNKPAEDSLENWHIVCNEIMQTLRKRELQPGQYTRKLIVLIETSTEDPVIRDYAVQHLSQWIAGVDPEAKESDPLLISKAFDAMCDQASAASNGNLTLVGTTLNALVDAMNHGVEAILSKRENLQKIALKLAASEDGSIVNYNRSTALQAAALLNAPGLPELCRDLATRQNVAPDIRLGSVAALGLSGNAADLPLLETFSNGSPFKFAADAAIRRIQGRSSSR